MADLKRDLATPVVREPGAVEDPGDVGSGDVHRVTEGSRSVCAATAIYLYPREIEDFLYGHPDIEDVQVVGVPDERYGEELCAWIKLRAGAD